MEFCRASADGAGGVSTSVDGSLVGASARGGSDAAAPCERIASGTAGGGGMVAPTTAAAAKAGNADAGAASADGTETCDCVMRVHRPCSSIGRRDVETSDLHVSQGQLFSASLVEGSTQSISAPAGAAAGEEHNAAGFYVEKETTEDEEPQRDLAAAVVPFEDVQVVTCSGLEDRISPCGAVLMPKTCPSCSSHSRDTVEKSVADAEAGHRIGIEGDEEHLKPLGATDKQQQAGVFPPKEIAAETGDRQAAAAAWGAWRQREGTPVQIEVAVEEEQRHSKGAVFFGGGEQQTCDREKQELQTSKDETESASLSSVKEQQQEAWRRHNAREDVALRERAGEVLCDLDTFVEEFFEREQQHDRRERDMLPLQECTSVRSTSIDEVCSYADTLSPLAPSHSCGGSSGASSQASSQPEHQQQELQQGDISGSIAGARQQEKEQQRKNSSIDGDAAENRSDREGTRHDTGDGPAIPVSSGGSVQEAVHAVCFTSSRRIPGGLQEETVDEMLGYSSTEGRGRGRGRSMKHHLDSKVQKGRSTAARRGRSDTRRHPRARAAADAAASRGKAAGGALAARQGFAAERISSAEAGAAPERRQPEDRGDSASAGILEGIIGGGVAAAAAAAAGGCQPSGVSSSSRKRHRSRQHTVSVAPRSAGFGAAAGNALESNPFFSDVGWAVPFQQQQQRQAQHKQQHQQHVQQQLPYAGAASGGGPSLCVRGTEGRDGVHLSRSRQAWGMQQQQPQLGQPQQQWAQRQQHAPVGLHMQQMQQLHMQQHHVEQQQQQQQLQPARATGEAYFFLQECRLGQTGNFPGSTFVRQKQQAAEGWRLRERVSAGGSQRLDGQGGVAEAAARGVSARRRAGRRREKHSKYGEAHAAAGPAATGGDDGLHRRRRPAAAFTGPPSQPPTPLRLTAAVLLQLEGRGSLQTLSTRNTPAAVAGPRRGAAARTVNTKKSEGAADAAAEVGEVAVAGGGEEIGGAPSGDATAVVEESEGAGAAAGAQEDCGVAECEAATAAPFDRGGAAAVAAAKELSTAPVAEKQQGVQEQVGGVGADEGTETERHCEKVAGEDFEAVEREQEQQERQPGSEEEEQQQPGGQQREEHCTWQALLQQQLEEEEKEGGDPDSTFFWMVKQRAEELRDRTCAGAEHRDDAQGKDAAEGAGADGEGEHHTSGTVQRQRRIRPAAFERAEGLAGPSRDRYAKKSGERAAAGRTAARRSAVIPGIVAGVERGEAGLQSSGSDVSSEESTKGTVNHRCRDETTRVNLCANPSDMWYGLTTSDGKPVVLPARPSRWHNSSSRRQRRIHREQHRKNKALIARDRLAFHLHQLQLQQQQPLQQHFQQQQLHQQQHFQQQLQLHQQQLQQYQQQQQPLQQPQLPQLLHQRALPQQQQQAGQQPPHHQQFSQPPQPHGFGGAVGYPGVGGWMGLQVVGGHVQYSEREMPVSERGQPFAPAATCRGPVYTSAAALSAERTQVYAMAAADKTQVFPPAGATERRHPLPVDRGDLAFAHAAADRGQGYLGSRRQVPAHAGVQGVPLHEQQHGSYPQQMGYWGSAARGSSGTRNAALEEVAAGGNAQQRPQQGRSNPQASQQQQQLPPQPFRPAGKQGGHHHPQRRHHYHEHKKRARSSLSSAAAGGGPGTSGSAAAATSSAAPAASVPLAGEEGDASSFSSSAGVMGASQPQQSFPQQQQRHQQHSRHRRRHPLHHSRRHGGAPSSSSRSRRSRGNDRLVYVCPEAAAPGGPAVAAPAATGSSAAGTATAGGTAAAGASAAAERASSAELAVTAGDSSHSRSESATEGNAVAARAAREGGTEGASGVTDSVRAVAASVVTAPDEAACTSEEECTSEAAVPSSRDEDSGMCLTDATSAAPQTAAPPLMRRGVAHAAGEATGAAAEAAEAAGWRKEHWPRDESTSSPQRAPRRARLDESGAFRPVVASSAAAVGGGGGTLGVSRRMADTQEGRTREGTAGASHGALPQQTDGGFKVPRPLPFFKRIRRGGVAADAATTGEGVARASCSTSARAAVPPAVDGRETGPLNSSTSSSSSTKNAHTSSYPNPFPLKPCEPLSHAVATAAGSVCAIAMSASSGVSSESLLTSASAFCGSSVSSGFGGSSSCSSGSSSSVSSSSVSSGSHSSVWPCSTHGGGADQRPLPSYRDLYCGSSRHSRPVENFAADTTKPCVPSAQEEVVGGGKGSGCRRGLRVHSGSSGRSDTQTEACVDSEEAARLPNRDDIAAVARASSLPCESVFPTIQGGDPIADEACAAQFKSDVHPTPALATHGLTSRAATSSAAGGGGAAWTDVAGASSADSMRTSTASCAAAVAASCLAPAAGVASGTPCMTAGSAAGSAATGSVSAPVQVGIVVERGTVGVPSSAVYYETPFRRSKPRRGCVAAGGGGSSHSSKKKKVSRKKSRNSSSSNTTQVWCISAREHVQWQLAKSRGML